VRDADVEFSVRIWSGVEAERVRDGFGDAGRAGEGKAPEAPGEAPQAPGDEEELDLDTWRRLERVFGWSYPYEALTRLPAKVTVTEIARLSVPDESEVWEAVRLPLARPAMLDNARGISASERGTAVHAALSRLDPADLADAGKVRRGVAALVERGILSHEQGEAVDAGRIAAFFQSPLGVRILRAPRLWRELSFTMRLEGGFPGGEALFAAGGGLHDKAPALVSGYRPVVQGAIDCLAVDERGALLVDFKTDRVRPGEEQEAAERYAPQLLLYREFALRWLGGNVAIEPYVVFLETGAAVRIEKRDGVRGGRNEGAGGGRGGDPKGRGEE